MITKELEMSAFLGVLFAEKTRDSLGQGVDGVVFGHEVHGKAVLFGGFPRDGADAGHLDIFIHWVVSCSFSEPNMPTKLVTVEELVKVTM